MIITFVLKILDCAERPEAELLKDLNGPRYNGSASIRKSKKTKAGARIELEDLQSYKSFEKIVPGEHTVEAELSAYSVDGNTGISLRILKVVKAKS